MGASAKTIAGDFPPSSSVTFFRLLLAAASWIFFPTEAEPVKLNFEMSLCDAIADPVSLPPVMNWITPGGKPASAKSGPRANDPKGDFSEALKMNCSVSVFERVCFGRCSTYGVASCQSWSYLPTNIHERRIPRSYSRTDSDRFVPHDLVETIILHIRPAFNLVCPASII